jgi:hypothetical protein
MPLDKRIVRLTTDATCLGRTHKTRRRLTGSPRRGIEEPGNAKPLLNAKGRDALDHLSQFLAITEDQGASVKAWLRCDGAAPFSPAGEPNRGAVRPM